MEFSLETTPHLTIKEAGDNFVVIDSTRYESPLILTPSHIITDWDGVDYEAPSASMLDAFKTLGPELIILATGKKHHHLPEAFLVFIAENQVPIESMSTNAACQTYNVLCSEGRRVVLGVQF